MELNTIKKSLFEQRISQQTIYIDICSYLNLNTIKNMNVLNKNINKNKLEKTYANYIVKNCSSYVITKFMRKLTNYIKINKKIANDENISQETLALHYFIFYTKNHINSWYNNGAQWKKAIIDSYNPKNILNPTRFDLYNLIKKMAVNDVYSIGW
jgi:hypothetical protein